MSANDIQSHAASVLRFGRGLFAASDTRQPEQTLQLYDHEACPFCRKVRDVMSELDLEYIERSCPSGWVIVWEASWPRARVIPA